MLCCEGKLISRKDGKTGRKKGEPINSKNKKDDKNNSILLSPNRPSPKLI